MRGQVNDEVKELSRKMFGGEISVKELRLLPYLDYCSKNAGEFDLKKLSKEEQEILNELIMNGDLEITCQNVVSPTKRFYNFMQDVLIAGGYVELLV